MPTAAHARLQLNFVQANGSLAACVLHAAKSGGGTLTPTDLANLGGAVKEWYNVAHGGQTGKLFFNLNTQLRDCTVTAFGQTPQIQHVEAIAIAGSAAGFAAPNESALVSSWYTGNAGKSYRGRTFWPGYDPDTLGNDGLLLSATATSWTTTLTQLMGLINAPLTGGAYIFSVYSRKLDVMTGITSVVMRRTPHHQRKRNV